MFHCYSHSWSHLDKQCPMCIQIYSTNNVAINIPIDWHLKYQSEHVLRMHLEHALDKIKSVRERHPATNDHVRLDIVNAIAVLALEKCREDDNL